MINYKEMLSLIDIQVSIGHEGFYTLVKYSGVTLHQDGENREECEAIYTRRDLGFIFPIYAPSRIDFNFDTSLKGWRFDTDPVRFITQPGIDFSAPIYHGLSHQAPLPVLPPERFSIVAYWLRPGAFEFNLHMIDPSENKIIIDPIFCPRH